MPLLFLPIKYEGIEYLGHFQGGALLTKAAGGDGWWDPSLSPIRAQEPL